MVYLFFSKEQFLLNKEINKIINDNKIEDININTYDLNQDNIKNIIEDSETFSMFDDKKIIIINNAYIFTAKKNDIEQDCETLEKYLSDVNPSTILIFNFLESKLDERKKVVKALKKYGVIKDLDTSNDIKSIIKDMFKPYKITQELINLLIDRVGSNLIMLETEIEKIKLYKDNDLNILEEDILNLTSENIDANMFLLVDMIINKEKEKALKIYHEMLNMNEEPIAIIITLANKIRSLYQTKELYKKGYSEFDIASILGVKTGYLYYLKDSLKKYDSGTLYKLLSNLADLDYGIKIGKVDKNMALELFILEN